MPIIHCAPPIGDFYLGPKPIKPVGLYGQSVDIDTEPDSFDRYHLRGFTQEPVEGTMVRVRHIQRFTKDGQLERAQWVNYCRNTRLLGVFDGKGVWLSLNDDEMPIAWCPYPRPK